MANRHREVVVVEAVSGERTAMSPARRLLPWFFWAQLLAGVFLGGRGPVALYVATIGILGLAAWGVTRKPGETAGLLGLVRPHGKDWLRVTGLLVLPVIIWPRIAGIPFSLIWPEAPVPVYPDVASAAILLAVVALGPLAEELLFRGVLLAALRPYGKFAALAVSSVIFGMLHGPVAFASTVMVGWAVGWLAWEYRSILPGLAVHVAFNAASAFGSLAVAGISEGAAVGAVCVFVALIVVTLVVTVRNRRLIGRVVKDPWRQRHVPGIRRPVIETLKLWPVTVMLVFAALVWALSGAFPGEI